MKPGIPHGVVRKNHPIFQFRDSQQYSVEPKPAQTDIKPYLMKSMLFIGWGFIHFLADVVYLKMASEGDGYRGSSGCFQGP